MLATEAQRDENENDKVAAADVRAQAQLAQQLGSQLPPNASHPKVTVQHAQIELSKAQKASYATFVEAQQKQQQNITDAYFTSKVFGLRPPAGVRVPPPLTAARRRPARCMRSRRRR